MDLTTALTGALPVILVTSTFMASLASAWLLRLYRRAVLRSMNASSRPTPVNAPIARPQSGRHTLKIDILDDLNLRAMTDFATDKTRQVSLSLLRLTAVYAMAGLAYALVMSTPWMLTADGRLPLTRLVWLVTVYLWPTALTLLMTTAQTPQQRTGICCGYLLTLLLAGSVALWQNPSSTWAQLFYYWSFANIAPTVLLMAFSSRKVRAVGPLVLVFMVAGTTGAFLAFFTVSRSDALTSSAASTGHMLNLGAGGSFALMLLTGFAVLGIVGWWLLLRLGKRYQDKRMSDQSLATDALWLLFGITQSMTLAFEGWAWVLTGLAAFTAYKLVMTVGLARLVIRPVKGTEPPPTLLLLRVFSLEKRGEQLFSALAARWLRVGSIDIIAGPDLLTSTLEPHEFLEFMGGRLSRQFIRDETDLGERLMSRDLKPDPDGRYRVNEFFCQKDTWRAAVHHLTNHNDAVLMDLRSLSTANQGCLWELHLLLDQVPLSQIVLLTDDSSDRHFLEEKIQEIWQQLCADSPNVQAVQPALKILVATASLAVTSRTLVTCLFDASRS